MLRCFRSFVKSLWQPVHLASQKWVGSQPHPSNTQRNPNVHELIKTSAAYLFHVFDPDISEHNWDTVYFFHKNYLYFNALSSRSGVRSNDSLAYKSKFEGGSSASFQMCVCPCPKKIADFFFSLSQLYDQWPHSKTALSELYCYLKFCSHVRHKLHENALYFNYFNAKIILNFKCSFLY